MPIDGGTLDSLKARLERDYANRQARLQIELTDRVSLAWHACNVGQPDRADAATVLDVDADTAVARLVRDYAALETVVVALDRMRSDRYGRCVDCGTEIERARLLNQPSVARCLDCAVRGMTHTTASLSPRSNFGRLTPNPCVAVSFCNLRLPRADRCLRRPLMRLPR